MLEQSTGYTSLESKLFAGVIQAMPDALTWQGGPEHFDLVQRSWLAWCAEALGTRAAQLNKLRPPAGYKLFEQVQELSNTCFERVLLAPETTFRLLPNRGVSPTDFAGFWHRAILAELAGTNPVEVTAENLYTALGDGWVNEQGSLVKGPQVAGLMPLDFDSPYSRQLDLTGEAYLVAEARAPLAGTELAATLNQLDKVRLALRATSPLLLNFVVSYTKVLILQKDPGQPFSSGSNGDYVGRSVIANPQIAQAAALADALVHEAIHSILYMQEEQQPWVMDQSLYSPTPCVVSPWSGRLLPVRPFMQACFVWYGLANFWAMAAHEGSFEFAAARTYFARAASGFFKGSLLQKLTAYQPLITVDLLETINEMQTRLLASLEKDL